ncbi:Mannosyl-oligosaccharide 1-2-alpha-mannosidase [Penicillium maclennaniae]|uniref:Mannosyl-oligosaccharide 1-2-alpha-mannosidase n=1 Tax=Penicillium maclennaniae TaxID=1343394 RepID=UPI002540E612|nr:Mannosyl-oligosaccharide 1-2-alpha-mannosidase [Penicillium maclennaniae]KAJ5670283.1 Mannosyl-oligosaccharide 1-2-alpha-mannosidase [Penicillium maclennaniae]
MSFQAPQSTTSWRPIQKQDSRKGITGLGLSAPSMGGFFDNDRTLPMYKDKPFAPRRTAPRRWRKPLGILGIFILVLLWYFYYSPGLPAWKGADSSDKGHELWKWVQSLESAPAKGPADWDARREKVRDAFIVSWEGYEKEAWGYDEYHPVSGGNRNMVKGGMGWIIVDSLDTMILMNLTSQVRHARQWISTSLQYNQDHDVSTFETTIRMLGGLLSANYLSAKYPTLAPLTDDDVGEAGEDLYIEKATDLADRLLGAFESPTGIPYASVNLNKSEGLQSHSDGGASSTAEATSLQLEFKYLAKLTGEPEYWNVVEKVMEVTDDQKPQDGLVPIYINPKEGTFHGNNIRLGSRGDSYYEYLIKQYLQTSEQEPIYKEMWDESLKGIRKHLLAFSKNAQLLVLGERPSGLEGSLSPKMDHLVCFMPGTIALGATGGKTLSEARNSPSWSQQREEEILISKELMKTCWATYKTNPTGLAGEISHFILDSPPVMMADKTMAQRYRNPPNGPSQPPRPETIESIFYMYRITGDEMYREWGWEMFKSFVQHTSVVEEKQSELSPGDVGTISRIKGFTSLEDALTIPAKKRDNMESFWMAETLKYFYLLFSDREFISLEEHVFNTEAHPFPRFKPTGDLKTGWVRKPALQN